MNEMDLAVKRKKFLVKWALVASALTILYLLAFEFIIDKRPAVEWNLIKSAPGQSRPESQLIKLPNGQVFLINAGEAAGNLLFQLKKQKIKDVDVLILSSYGADSLSALLEMLKTGTRIKEILFNPFSEENGSWLTIKQKFLSLGGKLTPLALSQVLFSQPSTQMQLVALDKDALVLRLVHGKNSLALGLGNPSGLGPQLSKLNCDQLKTEVVLNYTVPENTEPYLDWIGCLKPVYDLSHEKGTFKILFKGDSFKLKRR